MIIGLTGYKQSGKSTAAAYLAEKYKLTRINFKDALVKEIKDNFPDLLEAILIAERALILDEWDRGTEIAPNDIDNLFQTKPPLMRALMQNYGTDVRRKDRDAYWTSKWGVAAVQAGNNIISDDVRFLNEAQAVKDAGGIIIRIKRSDLPTGGTHISETEQDQIEADHTIEVGPGEQEELYKQLDSILG